MQDISFDTLKASLDTKSYFEVPITATQDEIKRFVKDYFRFLSLPDTGKQQFSFNLKLDEADRGTYLGYQRRSVDVGFGYDNKEFFHYNSDARDGFADIAKTLPAAQSLLQSADVIYSQVLVTMQDTVRILDKQYPGIYLKFFPLSESPSCVLRILKYDRTRDGDFLAKGHYDRSACTIAIAESAPGLRIGKDDRSLSEVTHQEGQGLFFPGMSLSAHTSNELLPSWHDVVHAGDISYNEDTSRWAIVFFCSPNEPNYLDRTTVHTPIQQK